MTCQVVFMVSSWSPARRTRRRPLHCQASESRRPSAPLAVLLPTFSYLAYANEHASWQNPIGSTGELERLAAAVGPADCFMAEEELNSIYDRHRDGTGVCVSSWLRPVLNFRPTTPCPWSAARTSYPQIWNYCAGLDRRDNSRRHYG